MPDKQPVSQTLEDFEVFQDINRTLGIFVGEDATDPLDHDEYVIPPTTPMAPVHTQPAAGTTHDIGLWMPIRRSLVTDVDIGGTDFTVVDVEPFKVGDYVVSIDATGPTTGGGVDLAAITAVDYDTNIITVADTTGLAADDWVCCLENMCTYGGTSPDAWRTPWTVGMLLNHFDARLDSDASSVQPGPATVVTGGAIRSDDVNFVDDPTDDIILIYQMGAWSPGNAGIQLLELQHGDEAVELPDA